MKLDKETLLKNKFWVVLAAAAPMALLTIFVLTIFVSSAIGKKKADLEKKEKSFGPVPETPNDENIEKWQKLAESAQGKRSRVWKDAWDAQKDIYQWPKAFEDVCKFNSGYFATEVKIDGNEADAKHFAGKIVKVDTLRQEWIEVENKDGTRRFRRVPNVVMVDPAKKNTDFQKLQPGLQVSVEFHQYRNFYDPLTEVEYLEYMKAYKEKDEKKSPLWQIIKQVNPVIEQKDETKKEGENMSVTGVVLLGNAPLKYNEDTKGNFLPPANLKCFRYVPQWTNKDDISEDVWLAQEDLWIQKELFYRIKLANESISHFELAAVAGEPPPKKKVKDKILPLTHEQIVELNNDKAGSEFTFRNPYWQLKLKLVKGKVEYKLENLLPRRQKLNVDFMVRLNDTDPKMEKLVVGGTTLDPKPPEAAKGEEKDVKQDEKKEEDSYFKTGTLDVDRSKGNDRPPSRTGVYAVQQVLTSETAAVKRIDMVSIGDASPEECSHSHRTFPDKLRSFKDDKKDKEPVEKKDDAALGDPIPLLRGPDKAAVRKTENGLLKDRYLDVTPEGSRRIPVAVVLIVDQEQIDRVLTSFRNSPLRFLTTQVLLNRYPHALQTATGPAQGVPPPPQFGIIRPREPIMQPRQDPALQGGAGASEANVELVIYGQVTLYNRFRDTPAAQTPKQ